jgi:hypothetical protein
MKSTIMPVIMAAPLAVLAWGSVARADCTKDTDCKGDRVCNKGQCVIDTPEAVAPAAAPAPQYAPAPQPATYPASAPPGAAVYYPVMEAPTWHYASPALRKLGIGLFIGGAALDIGGTITYAVGTSLGPASGGAFNFSNSDGRGDTGNGAAPTESIGELLWIVGGVATATGVVLWIVGSSRAAGPAPTEMGWLRRVTPYLTPTSGGARGGVSVSL